MYVHAILQDERVCCCNLLRAYTCGSSDAVVNTITNWTFFSSLKIYDSIFLCCSGWFRMFSCEKVNNAVWCTQKENMSLIYVFKLCLGCKSSELAYMLIMEEEMDLKGKSLTWLHTGLSRKCNKVQGWGNQMFVWGRRQDKNQGAEKEFMMRHKMKTSN